MWIIVLDDDGIDVILSQEQLEVCASILNSTKKYIYEALSDKICPPM
jgi:hypothetical protein